MIEILSIRPTTAIVSIRGQIITVRLFWFDGTYLASTMDLGVGFNDFDGRGSNAIEAISDLFGAIGTFLMSSSDQLQNEGIQ